MKSNVVQRGKTWSYVIELPAGQARDCSGTPRPHRVWCDEHDGDSCPRCGQPLGEAHQQRRTKWCSGFPTKKAAVTARRKALSILGQGRDPFRREVALRSFVHEALVSHWQTSKNPRTATWERYVALLDQWVMPDLGNTNVSAIGPRHIESVLDAATKAGRAPRTVQHIRAALSAVFTQAMKWQMITSNPVALTEAPTAPPPELQTPSFAAVRALIATALTDAAEAKPGAVVRRYAPALLVSGTTGLRRSEVLGLRSADVDLDTGLIRVEQTLAKGTDGFFLQDPKTVKSRRTVKLLTDDDVAVIRAHKADQAARRLALGTEWNTEIPDLLFDAGDGSPIPPDAYTRWALRYFASHDLDGVRLHDLRHALASHLIDRGAAITDVAAYLGHSQVTTTLNTYAHAAEHHVDRVALLAGSAG